MNNTINRGTGVKTLIIILLINFGLGCWILPQIMEPAAAIDQGPCQEGVGYEYLNGKHQDRAIH